jgi:hypothetical protein
MRFPVTFLLLIVLQSGQVSAQSDRYSKANILYVWAVNGLMLRTEPDLESKVVMKLPYGQPLVALEVIHRNTVYEIMPSVTRESKIIPALTVTGNFIRVTVAGASGYVYDGLLSSLEPAVPGEGFEKYFNRVFGKVNALVDNNFGNSQTSFKRMVYKNGAVLQEERGNSYWDHSYFIPDISLSEAYLLYNGVTNFEKYYRQSLEIAGSPDSHPLSFEENRITLQGGFFDTTEITIRYKYAIITSSGGN